MRVIKAVEWELVGCSDAGFVFKSTRYPDEHLLLKQAKYVLSRDVVLFMTLDDEPMVVPSKSTRTTALSSVHDQFQQVMSAAQSRFKLA